MPEMFDTTNVGAIPASAGDPAYAAGYVDGNWPTFAAISARYTQAVAVSISAIPGSPGSLWAHFCDCEFGDYTPDRAAAFAKRKIDGGNVPGVYCSLSDWPVVQRACAAIGIDPNAVDWWIAAYPGIGPVLYIGSVAHQFVDHGQYDESVVLDRWIPGRRFGVPIQPAIPPSDFQAQEQIIMGLPTGCTDDGAIRAEIRETFNTYSTVAMTSDEQTVFLAFYHLPANQTAWGKNGYGGDPDLLKSAIVDYVDGKGHTRPERKGSI